VLFNSFPFILGFLPPTLAGYWLLRNHDAARLWFLLGASLVFYAYWDWRFAPLLMASIVVNWLAAEMFFRMRHRGFLLAAIVVDLLCLALFKYLGFFAEIAAETTGWRGEVLHLALPLGISFFTFHHIIYLADLLRGRAPRYSFRDYALYIALFPQILAGPLVRHSELVFQFALRPMRDGWERRLAQGIALFLIGLGKKIFIADALAATADPIFARSAVPGLSVGDAWSAALAFPFQIYFDFYLYIPLGGNRHGLPRQVMALLCTMVLGGLWHGAGWTFVIWGALHGLGLAMGVLWRRWLPSMPAPLGWALLMLFLLGSWVLFRSPSLAAAGHIFAAMAGEGAAGPVQGLRTLVIASALAFLGPTSQSVVERIKPYPWLAPVAALATLLAFLQLGNGPAYEFIYFRF